MNAAVIISARGVAKRFGDFEALASLDLEVRAGECVGLLGPNGAGKSTFIGCLYGVVARTGGELEVFGHALLEHALTPAQWLVGKALVVAGPRVSAAEARETCAQAIGSGAALGDPLDLRPLPLAGVPGWHPGSVGEAFFREAACFRPVRAGRSYPPPLA